MDDGPVDAWVSKVRRGRSVVIGWAVSLISSVDHMTCKQGIVGSSPASGILFLLGLFYLSQRVFFDGVRT